MTRVILANDVAQLEGLPDARGRVRRYGGNMPGQVFDMDERDARAVVKLGGAYASLAGAARRDQGYRCPACGFGSWFKVCSRCKGECERE